MTEAEVEISTDFPVALYRLYTESGSLLYVGITEDLKTRFATHAMIKDWWPQVARKTVSWHVGRAAAMTAEAIAIRDERPTCNIRLAAGISRRPDRHKRAPISVRPPEPLRFRLMAYAQRTGRPVNQIFADAIQTYIDRYEQGDGGPDA